MSTGVSGVPVKVARSTRAWIETAMNFNRAGARNGSHALRVRGLKLRTLIRTEYPNRVARSTRAWIETDF